LVAAAVLAVFLALVAASEVAAGSIGSIVSGGFGMAVFCFGIGGSGGSSSIGSILDSICFAAAVATFLRSINQSINQFINQSSSQIVKQLNKQQSSNPSKCKCNELKHWQWWLRCGGVLLWCWWQQQHWQCS
jgi:hypothetical protein